MKHNFKHSMSLKIKITLLMSVIVLISIWSMAFYASRVLQKDMYLLLGEQQFTTASIVASQINQELDDRFKSLEGIAGQISPAVLHDTATLQTLLENNPIIQNMFNGGTFVTGIDGTAIADVPLSTGRIGTNHSDREWMIDALKGKSTVGKPSIGRMLHVPIFSMATPIRDAQGKIIGALAGVTDMSKPCFLDRLTDNRYGRTGGYVLVAPQYRLVVTATDKSRIMTTLPPQGIIPSIDRHIEGHEGSTILVNPLGVEILSSKKWIPLAGWYLSVSIPTAEVYAPIRKMQHHILLAAILLTFCTGGLIWLMLRRLFSPLFSTVTTLVAMTAPGKQPQPLPILRQDEIGKLIGSFNDLLNSLAQQGKALRESEKRNFSILNDSPVPMAINDEQQNITFLNPAFVQTFGYTLEDIPTLAHWWPQAYPDTVYRQEVADAWQVGLEIARRRGTTFPPQEATIRCKDLTNKTVLINASSISETFEGNHLVMFYDITERKNAEQELRHSHELMSYIIKHNTNALAVHDKDFKYLFVSERYLKDYKVKDRDVIGKHHYDVFPDLPQKWRDVHKKALAGITSSAENDRYDKEDGSVEWTTWECRPWYDAKGDVGGFVVYTEVVTDRIIAEEQKLLLQQQLHQAQKMEAIGTLAGGIAHDFNNILGAIMGFTEIARDSLPKESLAAKSLKRVMEASQRAATLVKQILSFSRQEKIDLSPLNPARFVKEALKLLRPSLPSTIEIRQQIDSNTKSILADPTQVQQVMMNLCTNAFHAMEQAGGILDITLKDCELSQDDLKKYPVVLPGSFVVLSVSDTGSGIDPDIWGRIFDPYFTTKGVGKGSGLGLSIVHGIVTSYGGFLTCENNLGGGTIFNVYFPAIDQEIMSESKPVEICPYGTERILFVDDEDILADLGKAMLEQLGYAVTSLTRSQDALALFQNQPDRFDVVITDQTMPGMTGMDFGRKILQVRPDLPIILCTGYSSIINEEQAKAAGFKGFAMKPLSKQVLATLLRKVLDERRVTG